MGPPGLGANGPLPGALEGPLPWAPEGPFPWALEGPRALEGPFLGPSGGPYKYVKRKETGE